MSWIELVAQSLPGMEIRAKNKPPGNEAEAASWYRIDNITDDETDLYVYDAIGGWGGVAPEDFVTDLRAVTSRQINLRINSPGGSVFDGITIANALRAHPANVTTYVDGVAASIASVIALAGNRVVMMPQSQIMIHDASGGCFGNQADMQSMADLLDKQSDNIAAAYAAKAGGTTAEWRDVMKAETWYLADEAVAAGLADEVKPIAPGKDDGDGDEDTAKNNRQRPAYAFLENSWDLSVFRYAGRENAPAPKAEIPVVPNPVPPPVVPQTITVDLSLNGTEFAEQLAAIVREAIRAEKPLITVEPVAVAPVVETPPEPVVEPELVADVTPVEPVDSWAALTAHLFEIPPSADDVLNRLKEAS